MLLLVVLINMLNLGFLCLVLVCVWMLYRFIEDVGGVVGKLIVFKLVIFEILCGVCGFMFRYSVGLFGVFVFVLFVVLGVGLFFVIGFVMVLVYVVKVIVEVVVIKICFMCDLFLRIVFINME